MGTRISTGIETFKISVEHRLTVKPCVVASYVPSGATTLATALTVKGIIDGDGEMFILAKAMKARGELTDDKVVCTVMSNGGFIHSLEKLGIKCSITAVGDRFVAEEMKASGAALGGEQSGHIILQKGGGNGIFTAIRLAELSKAAGKGLGELTEDLTLHPQLARNINVKDKNSAMSAQKLLNAIKDARDEMGDQGRIILRPSGTENLIRLMVEHENPDRCKQYVDKLVKNIKEISTEQE